MIEIILVTFLIISFLVIIFIFGKKINYLSEIEENKKEVKNQLIPFLFKKINSLFFLKKDFWHNLLLKFLSKIRIVILKVENKLNNYLNKLRSISKEKKK